MTPSDSPHTVGRADVVAAALSVIDREGLGAATTRRIAAELGIAAQSLYTHIDSRDELLDAVVDRIVEELDADRGLRAAADADWQPYLTAMARAVRRYARRHPRAFPLVATRPAEFPWINPPLRSLRWVERLLARLRAAGLTPDQTLFVYRSFNAFLLGFLLLETGAMVSDDPGDGDGALSAASGRDPVPGGPSPARSATDQRAQRAATTTSDRLDPRGRLDHDRYPTVSALAGGLTRNPFDAKFRDGLDALMTRVQHRIGPDR